MSYIIYALFRQKSNLLLLFLKAVPVITTGTAIESKSELMKLALHRDKVTQSLINRQVICLESYIEGVATFLMLKG